MDRSGRLASATMMNPVTTGVGCSANGIGRERASDTPISPYYASYANVCRLLLRGILYDTVCTLSFDAFADMPLQIWDLTWRL